MLVRVREIMSHAQHRPQDARQSHSDGLVLMRHACSCVCVWGGESVCVCVRARACSCWQWHIGSSLSRCGRHLDTCDDHAQMQVRMNQARYAGLQLTSSLHAGTFLLLPNPVPREISAPKEPQDTPRGGRFEWIQHEFGGLLTMHDGAKRWYHCRR